MSTTYRIEQWSRDGQILRAEYVDEGGQPYTLRTVLRVVDELREAYAYSGDEELGKLEMRVINNRTNQPIDEEYERQPWWIKSSRSASADSTHEVARMLVELANALRAGEDQPVPLLSVSVGLQAEYYGADREDVRRGHVELLARLTGQELTQRGATYESIGQSVYLSTYASPPVELEPVDEPDYPVDAAAEPELVDVARAVLQPDSLPDHVEADEERRCACGQPWALIISGHASHVDGCIQNAPAEAGETEDALGVPGLTEDEAGDFMAGGAR